MCYAAGSLLNRILGQVSAPQCPPWTISNGPVFVLQIAAAGRPFNASVGLLLALEIRSSKPPCSISFKLAKQWVGFHSSALELSLLKREKGSLAQVRSGPPPHWHLAVSIAVSSQLSFVGWPPLETPATGQDYGVTHAVRLKKKEKSHD